MDDVGLDTVLNIEEYYAEEIGSLQERPRHLCHQMIELEKLGQKSGKGFYEYNENGERILSEFLERVNN